MEKTKTSDIPQEVPMFLRKTYHMIDSCDPVVACWSEDGETFVVKDPSKFEKEIIPQFFKHSKFSSFVRQLNFYSFRKIKYTDTIRLDPKLEAETANFWRFKHENFLRGRPELLTGIKRMTAAQSKAAAAAAAAAASKVSPDAAHSSSMSATPQSQAMKSEIDTLKKQIEEMNRNMSELTSMVQQVSLTSSSDEIVGSHKRKKVEPVPESVGSTTVVSPHSTPTMLGDDALEVFLDARPDDVMFANDEQPLQLIPEATALSRESSTDTSMTDTDFVDQLFTVFGDDDEKAATTNTTKLEQDLPAPVPVGSFAYPPLHTNTDNTDNRPDSELMDRLSEALAVLPKEMQEQIVNRLIASIVSNKLTFGDNHTEHRTVPHDETNTKADEMVSTTPEKMEDVVGMPLAAATLASLLSYYSNLVQETTKAQQQQQQDSKHASAVKSIPVAIPCHA